jgi:hypothetical protein
VVSRRVDRLYLLTPCFVHLFRLYLLDLWSELKPVRLPRERHQLCL